MRRDGTRRAIGRYHPAIPTTAGRGRACAASWRRDERCHHTEDAPSGSREAPHGATATTRHGAVDSACDDRAADGGRDGCGDCRCDRASQRLREDNDLPTLAEQGRADPARLSGSGPGDGGGDPPRRSTSRPPRARPFAGPLGPSCGSSGTRYSRPRFQRSRRSSLARRHSVTASAQRCSGRSGEPCGPRWSRQSRAASFGPARTPPLSSTW